MPVKFMRKVPFEAFAIVLFLVAMNVIVWAVCLGVLVGRIGKCNAKSSLWLMMSSSIRRNLA
jgi:hypothetical protein